MSPILVMLNYQVYLQAFLKKKYQENAFEVQQVGSPHCAAQQNAWYAAWVLLCLLRLSEIFSVVLQQPEFDLRHFHFLLRGSLLLC